MSNFTRREVTELLVAWAALSIAFGFAFSGGVLALGNINRMILFISSLPRYFIIVGAAFLLHELSHKYTAIKYGYPAQFHLWQMGLLLALGMSFALGIVFAAPGAVYIYGLTDEKKDAKISLSGPLANMIVAVTTLALFRFTFIPLLAQVAYVSAFIGVFNLLPFGPLDGAKIFRHEKMWWIGLMAIGVLIILTL
ncbi:MAG: Zinc metalloprotease [Candidatus Methanofastidiosum methylothiophilum]|uniref:Zinc metalloprotease n=1 Tax=Candidatus Methanofastidiosum methylothiophilum TaxID=1705564 RepID=A0A150IPK4_9EURY|nr:MAG: Zinc metalloprotease [Candidatus Methanofastidiosum methylthiophilus]KYC46979.1 MAG: Zinc metalloprotease [Candidatus Methanofastidiosum methylthiophilus]KYC49632.1 MAG: Zinc metalloprotease [Candidatus Methanofastidiosum methylthiophilus]